MALAEINRNPSRRDLRIFSGLLIAFGAFLIWKSDSALIEIVAVIAGLTGLVGLAAPEAARRVYVGWMIAVSPVAFVVSLVILAAVFFLVVWPLALLMRLTQRDVLRLKVDRSVSTYWLPRQTQRDPRRCFRQY